MAGKGLPFLGWIIGTGGVVLLYSAYKNRSPFAALQGVIQTGTATVTPIQTSFNSESSATATGTGSGSGSSTRGFTATGSRRADQLKARIIKPNLVSVDGVTLDSEAAASFQQVEATYGAKIHTTGSFRSYAQQAAAYAANPGKFAPPGQSLHEVGLAVDVSSAFHNLDDPRLVAAFTNAGWYRQGKVINGRPEPWHWTYGVPG